MEFPWEYHGNGIISGFEGFQGIPMGCFVGIGMILGFDQEKLWYNLTGGSPGWRDGTNNVMDVLENRMS